mmetsp:Transcript_56724/g.113654  ORF Transcript_56724/g.113654 Transcript_56724/m.113654 type:complete len:817 (+) Transcript_56724:1697-4147(+)
MTHFFRSSSSNHDAVLKPPTVYHSANSSKLMECSSLRSMVDSLNTSAAVHTAPESALALNSPGPSPFTAAWDTAMSICRKPRKNRHRPRRVSRPLAPPASGPGSPPPAEATISHACASFSLLVPAHRSANPAASSSAGAPCPACLSNASKKHRKRLESSSTTCSASLASSPASAMSCSKGTKARRQRSKPKRSSTPSSEAAKKIRDASPGLSLCMSVKLRIWASRATSRSVMDTCAAKGVGKSKLMMAGFSTLPPPSPLLTPAGGGGGGEDGNPLKKKRLVMRETVRRWEFKEKLERSQAIRNTRAAIGGEGEATKGGGQDLVKDEANSRALAHSQRPDYCAACDSNEGCVWQPCCDVAAIQERQKVLASELHYTRTHSEALTLESYVPLSSMRGGSTSHRRSDLVEELRREGELMVAYLKLNHVDKELHDTCQASKEYVAVSSVHGYASLMWVGDAKKALGSMRDQLIARTLVLEIVDDLLEEMLEGWSFGEKESSFTVCGFVPSVKADGVVRSGGDQRRAVAVAEENRARKEASRKPGEVFDSERDGTAAAKNSGIEESAQQRLQRDHALRVVSDRDHHLSETETTLKFGAFLLALSYFKALTHVRREKASWLGNDDRLEGPVVRPVTDERRRMVGEQKQVEYRRMELERVAKKAARGGEARHKRFKHLREAEVRRFLDEIKAQKSKRKGSVGVQRLYRGHLGRKAAMRWATKKAELEAILALMHGSATTLQRAFRGFVGRMDAAEKRAEMAEFIAMMRMEESAAEEEDYWKENTFERLQRDWSIFWQTSRQVLSNSEALSYNTRTHLLPVQEY